MPETYVLIDFPGIKSFVFGTDKAKEIQGGSAILDYINTDVLREVVMSCYPQSSVDVLIVYSGGGKALLLLPDEKEQIERGFIKTYKQQIRAESRGGLKMEYAILPSSGKLGHDSEELHRRLNRKRYGVPQHQPHVPRVHAGAIRNCKSCSQRMASVQSKDGASLCEICELKQKNSRQNPAWTEFVQGYQFAEDIEGSLDKIAREVRPREFSEISSTSSRKGYMALVYADGDDMGTIIKKIAEQKDMKAFSERIEKSLKEATFRALREVFPREGVLELLQKKLEGGKGACEVPLPVDILLLGGDDLVLVIRAEEALPFVLRAAEYFQEESRKWFGAAPYLDKESQKSGLSLSFGVAFMKEKQPFSTVVQQAEALLKSAKTRRKEEAKSKWLVINEPYIDVLDVSQSRFLELEAIRKEDLGVGSGRELTCWPRPLREAKEFYELSEEVISTGINKGKLMSFAKAAEKQGGRSIFDTCRYLVRLDRRGERKAMMKFFCKQGAHDQPPWTPVGSGGQRTAIVDLAMLFRFMDRKTLLNRSEKS